MAKSTAAAALASLKHKHTGLVGKYTRLRGWYDALRLDHIEKIRLLNDTKATLVRMTELAREQNAASINADRRCQEVRVALLIEQAAHDRTRKEQAAPDSVSASLYHTATMELSRTRSLLKTEQNNLAKARNTIESNLHSALVYGAVACIAAYGAGIATQHWFPIAL